jgi:hypothetical protein
MTITRVLLAVLFIIVVSAIAQSPVATLLSIAAVYVFFKFLSPNEKSSSDSNLSASISGQNSPAYSAATAKSVAAKRTPIGVLRVFTAFCCKSCGGTNQGGHSESPVCEYCGSAAPSSVIEAPPVLPVTNSTINSEEETIRVSVNGYVCASCCKYSSEPGHVLPGSTLLEVFLWFLYIIPGVLYSMWRRSPDNAIKVCQSCESKAIVSITSPEGKSLFRRQYGRSPRFS